MITRFYMAVIQPHAIKQVQAYIERTL